MGEPFQWKMYETLDLKKKKIQERERQTNEEQIETGRREKESKKLYARDVQRNKLDFLISCRNLLRFAIKHSLAWYTYKWRKSEKEGQNSFVRSWLLLSNELRFCGWNLLTSAYAFLFLHLSLAIQLFFFSILYCFHGDECGNTATATLSMWCYSLCAQFTSNSSLSQLSKCSIHKHIQNSNKKKPRAYFQVLLYKIIESRKNSVYVYFQSKKKKIERRYLHINFWWSFLPMNRRLRYIGSMHFTFNNFSPFLPNLTSIKCRSNTFRTACGKAYQSGQ